MAAKKKAKVVKKSAPKAAKKRGASRAPTHNLALERKSALFTNEPDPLTIEPAQPLIQSPIQRQSSLLDAIGPSLDNEFDQADLLVLKDERLKGNLELFSQMVGRAYQGVDITQKGDEENPRVLDDAEIELINSAQDLDNRLGFKDLIKSYTVSLFKYGDIIEHIETDTAFLDEEFDEDVEAADAVTALTPLPMNQITIIDEASRIDDPEPERVITQANIYVIDEENRDTTEDDPIQYPKEEILHISLDNRTNWKEDLLGRNTFGIWSDAPLKSIIYLLEWKHNLIRNDMIWRNKMMPREHHKLNMTAFAPENYAGATFSARLNAAKIAATAEMNKYATSIRTQQPDQGYVTSNDVEIVIVEPKTTNYKEVNEQIDQIDSKISAMTGTPAALSGGTNSSFSSVEFSGTFVSLRSEEMCAKILRGLERVVWKHLKAVHPSTDIADIKRIKLKSRLILDRDLTERAKVVAILAGTNMFTPTEVRGVFGLEALTDSQQIEITEFLQANAEITQVGKSVEDTAADTITNSNSNDTRTGEGKSKRVNDTSSIGDRRGEAT
jgi:hypothetical protein